MEKTLRLDKLLSDSGQWSRKEAKQLLRQGRVQVDGQVERSADRKVCPAAVQVTVDGQAVAWAEHRYLMLWKPAGVLTATEDRRQKTVLDLYGELVAAQDARESLQCGNHALYACCPQLWDSRLQEELGCKEDPMQVLDKLFSLAEQDQLGGQALRFLGLLPEPPQKTDRNDGEEKEEAQGAAPGIETVKN